MLNKQGYRSRQMDMTLSKNILETTRKTIIIILEDILSFSGSQRMHKQNPPHLYQKNLANPY